MMLRKWVRSMPQVRARITVEWGYEFHSITLAARNWADSSGRRNTLK
jgi:hypothetical protein